MASPCFTRYKWAASCPSHHTVDRRLATAGETKPRQPRRLHTRKLPSLNFSSRTLFSLLVLILSLTSFSTTVAASEAHGDRLAPIAVADDRKWRGSSLILDQRPPPIVPILMPPLQGDEEPTPTWSAPPSKRSLSTDPSGTSSDFQVPVPFDTGLSNNFSTSCGNFITRLRSSDAFNNCHPFSLLLQTSSGFFDAEKSYLRITQTLDATCGVSEQQCKGIMDGFARDLVSSSNCKADYDASNAVVIQAYNGLVAYEPAYRASCLQDNEGRYCFANAVSNASSVRDSLPYYLPIGQPLPGGTRPTCNDCLQDAMGIFANYSNNASQPLSKTYTSAAQQISIACGQTFLSVAAAPMKGAAPTTNAPVTPLATLILMLIFYIFC